MDLSKLRGLPRLAAELDQLDYVVPQRKMASSELADLLALCGPGTMNALLEVLDGTDEDTHWTLERRDLLDGALSSFPSWAVAEVVSRGNQTARGASLALLTYTLLDVRGGAGELTIARDLVAPSDPEARPNRVLLRAYEISLCSILRRDVRAVRSLENHWDEWPASLWVATVKALGGTNNAAGLGLLTWLLQEADGTQLFLVQQIGRVAENSRLQGDFALEALLLESAVAADPSLRREACMTLGRLRSADSLGELIEMLTDDNAGVRDASYWALQEITGKTMRPEPARWQRWYAGEERWWRDEFPELRENLNADDMATVGIAIRSIGGRKLHRRELAAELLPLLQDRREAVVRMSIAGLGALGSVSAVEALASLLDAEAEDVRALALRALQSITGRLDLPAERAAWAEA